jgi:hypothetical protein
VKRKALVGLQLGESTWFAHRGHSDGGDRPFSLTSASGRFRIEVMRRPTGGYLLEYFHRAEERDPECGFLWEGWMPIPERVTLTDTPEHGVTLAAEATALWERQEAEAADRPRD